jgi:hypothetical protein
MSMATRRFHVGTPGWVDLCEEQFDTGHRSCGVFDAQHVVLSAGNRNGRVADLAGTVWGGVACCAGHYD